MRNQPYSTLETSPAAGSRGRENPRRRPAILAALIVVALAGIGVRVAYVQSVVADRFVEPWRELSEVTEVIPARDGRIVTRDGVVLAVDESRYDVSIDYRWLQFPPDPHWLRQQISRQLTREQRQDARLRAEAEQFVLARRDELIQNLAALTQLSEAELTERMQRIQKRTEAMLAAVERKRRERRAQQEQRRMDWSEGIQGLWNGLIEELTSSPDRYADDPLILKEELQDHVVLEDVSLEVAAAIQSQPGRFPGVHVRSASTRAYPHGELAAHVVGVRKLSQPGDSESPEAPERVGESGIERSQNDMLTGQPGLMSHLQDRHGQRLESHLVRAPQDGRDVVLTIDSRLQKIAEDLLDRVVGPEEPDWDASEPPPRGAVLIAMDIWTGDVLTMATSPRPSLSVLAHPSTEEWNRLLHDPRHPLFPRATRMALAPGAVFNVITSIAAMESGVISSEDVLECRGYLESPDRYRCQIYQQQGIGHGAVTVSDALCRSCNVFHFELGRRLGHARILDWAQKFGFGTPTGVDLPGEVSGSLPSLKAEDEPLPLAPTLQLATGQGELLVTPLQVARMMAAIANRGYLVTPRIVQESAELTSDAESSEMRITRIPGLSSSTLQVVQSGLERVVHDPQGTGQSARIEMMSLAGATGTAQVAGHPSHAWFAGYAPAQNPRVAFVVVLEHGGAGSAAGPIIRDYVTELLGYGYLQPYAPDVRQTDLD